jgi:DNA-directed RNA polymerase subunit RPC12/RpoP
MDAARPFTPCCVEGPAVNKMVCEDCATVYYSAAARIMVERGERCSKCGGKLLLADAPGPVREPNGPQRAGGGNAA